MKEYQVEEVQLNSKNEITESWEVARFSDKQSAIEYARDFGTQCDAILVNEFIDVNGEFEYNDCVAEFRKEC